MRSNGLRGISMVAGLCAVALMSAGAAVAAIHLAAHPLHVLLLAIAGCLAVLMMPTAWLPGITLLSWYGLSIDGAQAPFGGGLLLPEVSMLVWIIREHPRVLDGFRIERSGWLLLGSLSVLIATTVLAGQQFVGVLHLVLLAVVMLWLENGARMSIRALVLGGVGVMIIGLINTFEGLTSRLHGEDPAQLGFVALATWCLLIALRPSLPVRVLQGLSLLVVIMSQTRSVWLALVLVVIVRYMPRPSRVQLAVAGSLTLLLAWQLQDDVTRVLGLNPASGQIREASIRGSLSLVWENPVTGVGWVTDNASSALSGLTGSFATYNVLLGLAVPGGLLCAGLFLMFVLDKVRQARYVNQAALLIIVAFLAQGTIEMNLFPGSPIGYLLLVACGLVTERDARRLQADAGAVSRKALVPTVPRRNSTTRLHVRGGTT